MRPPLTMRRWRDRWAEHAPLALLGLALWCAMLPLAVSRGGNADAPPASAHEWPRQWDGQPLQPLASSAVEQRFAAQFPGHIARFAVADGSELVLRDVQRPTRMLHPASDCWRGIGWRIEATRLHTDARAQRWRCFEASRGGQRVRVCERIVDTDGQAFTDASAWFWAASLQRSRGPWQAVTLVEALP